MFTQLPDQKDVYQSDFEGTLVQRAVNDAVATYRVLNPGPMLRYVLMQVLEDAEFMRCRAVFTGLTADHCSLFNSAMPNHFTFEPEGDETSTSGSVTYRAVTHDVFSNSLFFNNEDMVPPPSDATFKQQNS